MHKFRISPTPTGYLNRVYVLTASSSKHTVFHYFRLGLKCFHKIISSSP